MKIGIMNFTSGENQSQIYEEYRHKINNDGLLVFKNKRQNFWQAIYVNNQGGLELIPETKLENGKVLYFATEDKFEMLEYAKNWYKEKYKDIEIK